MADRDELVRRALIDAAAPRPLAPATRDRLAALVRDDADARLAALLREAAAPRALSAPARTRLHARLSTAMPVRRAAGVSRRVTLALASAAAAVVVVGTTAVVLRPAEVPGPVARPAPTVLPTASPGGSQHSVSPQPTPVATGAPGAGGGPGPTVSSGSSGPTVTPSAVPQPGDEPAGGPGAPGAPVAGAPGMPDGGAQPQPQRSVTGVNPDLGPLAGGTVITVRGSGLSAAVRVEVDGRRAGSLQVESDSELTAETPAGTRAGSVTVVVVMADGGRYGLSPGFTYVAAPILAAISPDRGPTAGGNVVMLSGDHFRADAVVHFGTTRAEVRHLSPTSIEVVAPEHLVGPVDVTVTTPGGTSAERRYTYVPG
ncbi:MAG TPA: IPT/TIG domain-containing protein [Frankiaceae bacterium]|nr:IPT/TIG domain-containing protein [Frankiaceae bacterium]